MPARIVVDDAVPESKRPSIVDAVRVALERQANPDSLTAIVTRLPSGKVTVFVDHIDDPALVATIEAAIARL